MKRAANALVPALTIALSLVAAMPALAQSSRTTIATVKRDDGSKASGNAFTLAGSNGRCVFITAAHVLGDPPEPALEMKWSVTGTFTPQNFHYANADIDFAISDPLDPFQFGGCPGMPRASDVGSNIDSRSVEIDFVTPQYDLIRVPVVIHSSTDGTSYYKVKRIIADDPLSDGMSGAPLLSAGKPIGIFLGVNGDGTGNVLRLDALPANLNRLSADDTSMARKDSVTITGSQATYTPYDITQLPASIQDLVKQARTTRSQAETAASLGRDEAAKAQAAADQAKRLPMHTPKDGLEQYRTDKGDFYAGDINAADAKGSIDSYGYGVQTGENENNSGNVTYCYWNKGCQGPGVEKYGSNSGNPAQAKSWEGYFKDGQDIGFGIETLADDALVYQKKVVDAHNTFIPTPGVWAFADGRRFEGMLAANIIKGVIWDKQGNLICSAVWTNGKVDAAETARAGLPPCDR